MQAFTGGYQPIDWKLENSQLFQSNMLKEITPGITYQSMSGYGEEVIVSSNEFSRGIHGFRVRFDDVSENYRCHVLLGLYDLTKKKDEFKPYMCVMCCDHIDSMISKKKGQKIDIHRNSQLEICANFDQGLFEIKQITQEGQERCSWVSTMKQEPQKNKRKKFFIFFSSSGQHRITLISSY